MRKMILLFLIVFVTSAFARSPRPNPYLGKIEGSVSGNGEINQSVKAVVCFVYMDKVIVRTLEPGKDSTEKSAKHNLKSKDFKEILMKLYKAKSQKETMALHITEAVPNVYRFGNTFNKSPDEFPPTNRVRLYYDGSRMFRRQGPEARELNALIEELCALVK